MNNLLIIFAKEPVSGKVKTRLIPEIGPDKALSLYSELLSDTLKVASNSCIEEIHLYLHGDTRNNSIQNLVKQYGVKVCSQSGDNLGERMLNAFKNSLTDFKRVIIIGTDCPSLELDDISQANNALDGDVDIVLGPAEDGGYYLIGLKQDFDFLFKNIEWGSGQVLSETLELINQRSLNYHLLQTRWDLDRPSDLKRYSSLKNESQDI